MFIDACLNINQIEILVVMGRYWKDFWSTPKITYFEFFFLAVSYSLQPSHYKVYLCARCYTYLFIFLLQLLPSVYLARFVPPTFYFLPSFFLFPVGCCSKHVFKCFNDLSYWLFLMICSHIKLKLQWRECNLFVVYIYI